MSKTFGIKVSQDGKNAKSGADSEMVMNSNFNSFKIVSTTPVDWPQCVNVSPSGTNSAVVTIPHNLGYIPTFVAYISLGTNTTYLAIPYTAFQNQDTGVAFITYTITVDRTNIYLSTSVVTQGTTAGASTPTYSGKVFLLQETAAPAN